MSAKKESSTLKCLMMVAILTTLAFLALRSDGVIEWAWYWLCAPIFAYFCLVIPCALVAAIVDELNAE